MPPSEPYVIYPRIISTDLHDFICKVEKLTFQGKQR
jgi:hypothetical protein